MGTNFLCQVHLLGLLNKCSVLLIERIGYAVTDVVLECIWVNKENLLHQDANISVLTLSPL